MILGVITILASCAWTIICVLAADRAARRPAKVKRAEQRLPNVISIKF